MYLLSEVLISEAWKSTLFPITRTSVQLTTSSNLQ